MSDCRDTLILPFERGLLPPPADGERFAFLNARPLPHAVVDLRGPLLAEQGFRPDHLALASAGYETAVEINAMPGAFAGALVLAGRVRLANQEWLRRAAQLVKPGGMIAVAGNNKDGIQPLRKWAGERVELEDSLSKHHAVAFWFVNPATSNPFPAALAPSGRYATSPGMFSADGPDGGSVLLAGFFDTDIGGAVADFGAGWGYLGASLLAQCPKLTSLDCLEADHASLEAAKVNLGPLAGTVGLGFHWLDIVNEPAPARYDAIVMNPPFHLGRAADPGQGVGFIEAAARALKPGGRLLMVANRQLPYEAALGRCLRNVQTLRQTGNYKVIRAQR